MAITNVVNANGTTPLAVGQGGTSTTSLTTFALLKGDAAGHVSSLPAGTNGQLPIGSTASDPVMATLTAGSGISITNGAGSITIAATGGGGGGITDLVADDTNTASGSSVNIIGDLNNIFTTADNASTLTISQGPALVLPATNAALTEGVIFVGGGIVAQFLGTNNTFLGAGAGNGTLTFAAGNIGIGLNSLAGLTEGTNNIAMGEGSIDSLDEGSNNIGIGFFSLSTITGAAASNNTAVGFASLSNLATGNYNVAFGNNAGTSLNGSETSNILIGNTGIAGDNHTIRIGTEGTSDNEQSTCYIAGIANATVTGSAVLVDVTTGQLGLAVSSQRFKQNIYDMGKESDGALKLRPVTFSYKNDVTNAMQYGLIAEEVADVMPHLVTYDAYGQPYTVRYQDLPAILLNEMKKMEARIQYLESKIKE